MGRSWGLLACALASACSSSGAFTCLEDSQCVAGEARGLCEDNGHCSFEDPQCDSGRRYGNIGPSDLGGTCVSPPDTASSSSTGSGSAGTTASAVTTLSPDDTSDSDGDASTAAISTTDFDDESSSTTSQGGSDEGTTTLGTSSSPSTSSTGEDPPACPTLFDEFNDGDIDPQWHVFLPKGVQEFDDELRITLHPPEDGFSGVGMFDSVDFDPGVASVELGDVPTAFGYQMMFMAFTADEDEYSFIVQQETLEIRERLGSDSFAVLSSVSFEPSAHRWLRFWGTGESLHFQVSEDGIDYDTLYEEPNVAGSYAGWTVNLAAIDFAPLSESPVVSYRRYEYCDEVD